MKVVSWTEFPNTRCKEIEDSEFDEAWQAVIGALRETSYHFDGSYHQYGKYGCPLMDNGKYFNVSQRSWGRIMAEAFPEEFEDPNDPHNYVIWYLGVDNNKAVYPEGDE